MAATRATVNSQLREFYIPEDAQLRALVPEARDVVINGDHVMSLPHTTDVTRLARNCG